MTARRASAVLLVLTLAGVAGARGDPADRTPAPLPQVTVDAARIALEKRVSRYVSVLTRRAGRNDSLQRWQEPVCPLVAGLGRPQGEFMLARISAIAREAQVPLGPSVCHPNFYIVATLDPAALLKSWERHDRRIYSGGQPAAVQRFLAHDRPVRVWYNTTFGSRDNGPVDSENAALGTRLRVPVNDRADSSRLLFTDLILLSSVIVVIDMRKVEDLQYGQLTDYVAMLGFTELDPDLDFGDAPSILQLFRPRAAAERPAGLTPWDAAFLRSLYATDQSSVMQRETIIERMMKTLP